LKKEGVTYSALSDELKKEFGLSYLKRPDLSISEVAYLLDYSEPSTFSRSFKRWMGMSPAAYKSLVKKEKRPV
jgi:AraC-like DNA-binding protein